MLGFVVFSLLFFSPRSVSAALFLLFFLEVNSCSLQEKKVVKMQLEIRMCRGDVVHSLGVCCQKKRDNYSYLSYLFFFFSLVFIAPGFICMSRFFLFKFVEQKFVQRDVFVTPPSLLRPDLKTVKYLSYSE